MGQIKKVVKVNIKGTRYVCVKYNPQSRDTGVVDFFDKPNGDVVDTLKGDETTGKDFYVCLLESEASPSVKAMSIFVSDQPIKVADEFKPVRLCFGPCPNFLIECGSNQSPACSASALACID